MEEEHRKSIQKNFTSLVERTDLDQMVTVLYEKGVFSDQMIEPYKDTSRDTRTRKRQLYMDLPRRGPQAFGLLLEALTETGHWDLVRELDPNSALHISPRPRNPASSSGIGSSRSQENNFLSISAEKKRNKNVMETNESSKSGIGTKPLLPVVPSKIPEFHIVKSTKFFEENERDDIKLYRTRSRLRGILLLFSYTQFLFEESRSGADVDCHNLKYLFDEFGFKTLVYNNLTQEETLETLNSLRKVDFHLAECVFVVVSSHGHERASGSDVDVCCFDGRVGMYRFVEFFSNKNFPELRGKPKVFIFQICRGKREYGQLRLSEMDNGGARVSERDGEPRAPPSAPADLASRRREYSDILIAHSTVPGFVSYRDPEKGSWYIQALCGVFAARAHERHVHDLLMLVDQELEATFPGQTSSIEKWGFNRRLYLHPGLFED